jgi:hypothetical protein
MIIVLCAQEAATYPAQSFSEVEALLEEAEEAIEEAEAAEAGADAI